MLRISNYGTYNYSTYRVRDYIIDILGKTDIKLPQKIRNELKNFYNKIVTYQSVHKALNELLKEEVIIRIGNEYYINDKWLEQKIQYLNEIKTNIMSNDPFMIQFRDKISKENSVHTFTFRSHSEMDKYIKSIPKSSNSPTCTKSRHFWWALFNMKLKNLELKQKYKSIYSICKMNTLLDQWNNKFVNSIGINAKINQQFSENYDIIIQDNYIIQLNYSEEFVQKIDSAYNKKSFQHPNFLTNFYKIFQDNHQIIIVIINNKQLADIERKKILNYFKD